MACRFFARLAKELQRSGHGVHHIGFNAGDWLFGPSAGSVAFRDSPEAWPGFLQRFVADRGITHIVLFGDCRPLHRVAIAVARDLQVPVHVCEEGYLRPHWVTFEEDGVNAYSRLPRDPAWFLHVARDLPEPPAIPAIRSSFARRAVEDLAYNLCTVLLAPLYPHYRTHRPRPRLIEYAGFSAKVIRSPWRRRRTRQARVALAEAPYYLLPLQLNADSQIRVHSGLGDMARGLERVIASFARHAPHETCLVVKEHPLDDGPVDWHALAGRLAVEAGIAGRVVFLSEGAIDPLVAGARGVVTVNSTTGALALGRGVPVVALGQAIYAMPGLTHQGGLDDFWTMPARPDPALFAAFRRVLVARCLLAGDFFCEAGLRMLVDQAVRRLEGPSDHAPAVLSASRSVNAAMALS